MPNPFDLQTLARLKGVPYFQDLSPAMLQIVAQEVLIRHYKAKEMIFSEGEECAGLHLLVEGSGKLCRFSEMGQEHVLSLLQSGDSCNEVPAVDQGPNPVHFIALEATTVWVISGEALTRLRQHVPQLNDLIIKALANRCRQMVQRVYQISFLSVTSRLAAFILHQSAGQKVINRSWTLDEVAITLGTVRETVSRSLRELQMGGYILTSRHQIEIKDLEGLAGLVTRG
jgi:CRP/FNR family transcriptional regulator